MNIHAYNIYMTYNKEIIEVDLGSFFKKINNIDIENKLRKTYKNYPVLLSIQKDNTLSLGISFYKYRKDYKPYIENSNGILEQISSDVVELTNGLLDLQENLLILQYNINGLREKSIEDYLNTFIEGNQFKINIKKIYSSIELNDIINSNRIISVEPIFNNDILSSGIPTFNMFSGVSRFLQENIEEETQISLTIKNTQRNGTFSGNSLRHLIDIFDGEEFKSSLEDLKIKYQIGNSSKGIETKSINKLRRLISKDILLNEGNPSWERIIDSIIEEKEEMSRTSKRATEEIIMIQKVISETYSIKELFE